MPPRVAVRENNEPLPASFFCQHCLHCSYFGFERAPSGVGTKRPCPVCGSNNVFVPKTRDQLVHAYESAAINQSRKPSMLVLRSLIDLHVRTGGKVVMFRGGVASEGRRKSSLPTATTATTTASRSAANNNNNNLHNNSTSGVHRPNERGGTNAVRRTSNNSSASFTAQPPPLPAPFSSSNRSQPPQQQQQQHGNALTASSSVDSLGTSQRSQSGSFNSVQPPPLPVTHNIIRRNSNQPEPLPRFQEPVVPVVVSETRRRYSSSREGSREPSRQGSLSLSTPTAQPPRRGSQPQPPPPRPPTGGTSAKAAPAAATTTTTTTNAQAPRRTISVPRAANVTNISPPANASTNAPPPRRRTPDEVIAAQTLFPLGLNGSQVRTGQDTVCAVCFDECLWSKGEVLKLACKHFFHMDCIRPWIDGFNFNCPMCRHAL